MASCPLPGAFELSSPDDGASEPAGVGSVQLIWDTASNASEYDVYFGNAITANVGAPQAYTRIGVEIMPSALYTYTTVAAVNTFTCTATCGVLDDDPAADIWTINEQGDLVPLSDDSIL